MEEKRRLFTRMSKYSLQQEEKESFSAHQKTVDEQNILLEREVDQREGRGRGGCRLSGGRQEGNGDHWDEQEHKRSHLSRSGSRSRQRNSSSNAYAPTTTDSGDSSDQELRTSSSNSTSTSTSASATASSATNRETKRGRDNDITMDGVKSSSLSNAPTVIPTAAGVGAASTGPGSTSSHLKAELCQLDDEIGKQCPHLNKLSRCVFGDVFVE